MSLSLKQIKQLPLSMRKQIEEQLNGKEKSSNSISCKSPDLESNTIAKHERKIAIKKDNKRAGKQFDRAILKRATLTVRHRRHRLCDMDGFCIKAILDKCIDYKVLHDDSPEYLTEIRHEQIKIPKKEPECTILIFQEVD